MPFDSPDINLGTLLADIRAGKIRLPDFQREWKWDTDRITSLLASVSLGYPVGVVMLLESGGTDVQFATRLVSGVEEREATHPAGQLILDGQQRLTSLFQSLAMGSAVKTLDARRRQIDRWYYLDVAGCLEDENARDDAIVGVPADRVRYDNFGRDVELDLSTPEHEYRAGMFPIAHVFDVGAMSAWMMGYVRPAEPGHEQRFSRWTDFHTHVLANIQHYTVPVIVLKKDTPRAAVCTVFEKVNTGGIVLDVFELLTATFAASEFDLRKDWADRYSRLRTRSVLSGLQSTDFLQAIALMVSRERRLAWKPGDSDRPPPVSCRRNDILRLTKADYERWATQVEAGLQWAAGFLAGQRIFAGFDLPYRSQLVPLAAIKATLGTITAGAGEKLQRWFWCGVLGELYGGTVESRMANDLMQVADWIDGGEEPATVREASFDSSRLLTLRTRVSAAYKGVYALLLANGLRDWAQWEAIDLQSYPTLGIDIHHIFPKAWCKSNGIDDLRRESIVNKTAISARTNRVIGGKAPSAYLAVVQTLAEVDEATLHERLLAHLVEPAHLRADDFDAFFSARSSAILSAIGVAMGRPPIESARDPGGLAIDYDLEPEDGAGE